jgi:type II restriction/modification system DNA methylase subunit YeeA
VLANQGETAEDYRRQIPEPTFAPDEDNVIPLLDGDWFPDDISERFKAFLKITFGTEHYEENLTFLENGLYPDNLHGNRRKTIRDYFLKEFYDHHVRMYKKRPIYWLFSSPKGTFNTLIYMHRYRPDTVSIVLNDYLREFHAKLTAKAEHLQTVANSAAASSADKAKALKEIAKLKKDLKELADYEHKILYPLAARQLEIDLDDGVKVNYNKFGKALKKVTGLTE